MNVITVIPLTRSKMVDTLSYFTAADAPVGAIVSVPLRSKSVHAIVVETRPVEDMKADIKSASFEMKKLSKVNAVEFFPASFMASCTALGDYYATGVGAIIETLVAPIILEQADKLAPPLPRQRGLAFGTGQSPRAHSADETFAVQGGDEDRLSTWRSVIRQEFARKSSIAMYAPTIQDAKQLAKALTKGIEGYIFLLHTSMTDKAIAETWSAIAETEHPVVIVATSHFAVLPRSDVSAVIIERESSRGWISQKTPYLDGRHALETVARKDKKTVYLADTMLRTETLSRLDAHEIAEGSPMKWRSISTARDAVIDMKRRDNGEKKSEFRVISPELETLIRETTEDNGHLFIFTLRRGISPTTVCDDCETVVTCTSCSSPVVLHAPKGAAEDGSRNFFMCHRCGERRSAAEVCAHCGGWRLSPLGIGIDRVADELRKRFPDAEIVRIDADTTKTDKQVAEAVQRFRSKPGSILLGTEMALPYLGEPISSVAIASIDSLFTLPDFRIQEKAMYLLTRLRALAERSFLVQTRRTEEPLFEYAAKGNLSDFYRAAVAERKQFGYPPYSTLIKLTIEGTKDAIAARMSETVAALQPREVDIFPAFTSTVRGKSVIHGLLKVERHAWPDVELVRILRSLPPDVRVKIDPESLL